MSEVINLSSPPEVINAARKGLEFREKFGRGGTHIGIGRAKQLLSGHDLDL